MQRSRWSMSLCAALLAIVGAAGLSSEYSICDSRAISDVDAAAIAGGANDGWWGSARTGCGAVVAGCGQCPFDDDGVPSNWLFGVWGSPGLGYRCTVCGANCGGGAYIGLPTEG